MWPGARFAILRVATFEPAPNMNRASRTTRNVSRILAAGALLTLAACSGGGGGGGGGGGSAKIIAENQGLPNNTANQAQAAKLNRDCVGTLGSLGDVDYWSIQLNGGNYVRIALLGTRISQVQWLAGSTIPRLSIVDTDGLNVLQQHDYLGTVATDSSWGYGLHDLDFPLWRAPATGTYFLRLENDDPSMVGGLYAFQIEKVSGPTAQSESEVKGATGANDTPGTADPIKPGILRGWHVDGGVDFYTFTLEASPNGPLAASTGPALVNFDVTCYRNGVSDGDLSYADLHLRLLDSDGTTLIGENSDTHFADPALSWLLPPGTYFVAVDADAGSGNDGDAEYLLRFDRTSVNKPKLESEPNDGTVDADPLSKGAIHVGSLDLVTDIDTYRFSGKAGDMVFLELWDADNSSIPGTNDDVELSLLAPDGVTALDTGGDGQLEVQSAILQADGTYFVRVTPDAPPAVTQYHLRLTVERNARFETEVNNTIGTADKFNSAGRAAGVIATPGDVDIFSFSSKANRLVTFHVYAGNEGALSDGEAEYSDFGSDLVPVLNILDSNGAFVTGSLAGAVAVGTEGVADGLPVATVSFVPFTGGSYYVSIASASGDSGADQYYVIEMQ